MFKLLNKMNKKLGYLQAGATLYLFKGVQGGGGLRALEVAVVIQQSVRGLSLTSTMRHPD